MIECCYNLKFKTMPLPKTKIFAAVLPALAVIFFLAAPASARDFVPDWYLEDFQSEIILNDDSSLLITEKIVADCGNLPDKHGIFRVLPTAINTPSGKISTPVELVSITDFSGQPYHYETSRQWDTVTWKIGDPDKTVSGENDYKIVYRVKNAARAGDGFDELYWNLNGNYWDIETDNFSADLKFPAGLNLKNIDVEYFAGPLGSAGKTLAGYQWLDDQTLRFESKGTLKKGEGITVSLVFPRGVIKAYQATFSDRLPGWPWLAWPVLVFIACFFVWKRYGDDPNLHKTVIPEYEAPDNLTPLQVGVLSGNGSLDSRHITAAIIKMASDKILTIEETEKKILLFSSKDYNLIKAAGNEAAVAALPPAEKAIYEAVFSGLASVPLSEVKKKFYKALPDIGEKAKNWLIENGYMEKTGFAIQAAMFIAVFAGAFIVSWIFSESLSWLPIGCLVASGIITAVFALLMTKKTPKGAEAEWKIKGFKLFMNTAEKYRAQFYEKENMFEKILPYAIVFGLTKKWVEKMRQIYGDEKMAALAPAWYVSAAGGGFDADAFSASMNNVASAVASSVSAPSGRGGAGGAGGGGGGGGGGGW